MRDIQVKTGQAVLSRFYKKIETMDQEVQTDSERIAMVISHYEALLEAMISRETEVAAEIKRNAK